MRHLRRPPGLRHFLFGAGSAVLSQGCVSLANFMAGWWLLRTAGPAGYAQWVLAISAVVLLVSLQVAFLGPPLSLRMARLTSAGRGRLVGALLGEQQRGVLVLAAAGVAILAAALPLNSWRVLAVPMAGLLSLLLQLRREFLRQVLYASGHAPAVLGADLVYGFLLVTGVVSTRYAPPGWRIAVALVALGVAAAVARLILAARVRRHLAPMPHLQPGLLREIAPLAWWSTGGSALAWAVSQGFLTLVAVRLGPGAVAAIAATRLPMMPMNLLVSGLGGLLAPSAARWLIVLGRGHLLRRLVAIGLGLAGLTVTWTLLLWPWRDALFAAMSPSPIPQATELLLGWGLAYSLLGLRDTLGYLLSAAGDYRSLTLLAAATALLSTSGCLVGMGMLPDARGAMVGIVTGETGALLGMMWLVRSGNRAKATVTRDGTVSRA